MFDLFASESTDYNPLEDLALRGTGFCNGMKRVYEYFLQSHSIAEKAKLLKSEYGVGGFCSPVKKPCYIHSMNTYCHGKNDITFSYYDENMNSIDSGCSWVELAKVITDMIDNGRYKFRERD